jgi:hypothetical protein
LAWPSTHASTCKATLNPRSEQKPFSLWEKVAAQPTDEGRGESGLAITLRRLNVNIESTHPRAQPFRQISLVSSVVVVFPHPAFGHLLPKGEGFA